MNQHTDKPKLQVVWKDTTSWSRNATEEERKNPTTWELTSGELRILVHHWIGCGDMCFLSCPLLGIDKFELKTEDPSVAKKSAIRVTNNKIMKLLHSVIPINQALGE